MSGFHHKQVLQRSFKNLESVKMAITASISVNLDIT